MWRRGGDNGGSMAAYLRCCLSSLPLALSCVILTKNEYGSNQRSGSGGINIWPYGGGVAENNAWYVKHGSYDEGEEAGSEQQRA